MRWDQTGTSLDVAQRFLQLSPRHRRQKALSTLRLYVYQHQSILRPIHNSSKTEAKISFVLVVVSLIVSGFVGNGSSNFDVDKDNQSEQGLKHNTTHIKERLAIQDLDTFHKHTLIHPLLRLSITHSFLHIVCLLGNKTPQIFLCNGCVCLSETQLHPSFQNQTRVQKYLLELSSPFYERKLAL